MIINFFKRICFRRFYENDSYTISDMILYTDNDNLRDAIIALDNYDINQEPYDNEELNVINESSMEIHLKNKSLKRHG